MLQEQVYVCRQWLDSPLGQKMLEAERQCVSELEWQFFGYHHLHISPWGNVELPLQSSIKHQISLNTLTPSAGNVRAEPEQLPFEENSIDLVVLHHVLEFSDNPHQLLREVRRVLVPQGFVICLLFNPVSFYGLRMLFSSKYSFWNQNAISRHRLGDWLSLLEFEKIYSKSCLHLPAINNERFLRLNRWQQRIGRALHSPFGGINVIMARKDNYAVTPLKPDWKSSRIGLPIRPQVVQLRPYRHDKKR